MQNLGKMCLKQCVCPKPKSISPFMSTNWYNVILRIFYKIEKKSWNWIFQQILAKKCYFSENSRKKVKKKKLVPWRQFLQNFGKMSLKQCVFSKPKSISPYDSKNEQNCWNFCKKMKLKTRLVAGNGIWSVKIRPGSPLSPLEWSCEIFWPHLKTSLKKSKKTYPPLKKGPFFGGGGREIVVTCAQCVLGW